MIDRSRVLRITSIGASSAGALVSAILLDPNLVESTPICEIGTTFSCTNVLSSPYSSVYGVPLALLGLVWFVVAGFLSINLGRERSYTMAMMVWSILGLLSITYLVYLEVFVINSLCVYCTVAHVMGTVVFASAYLAYVR
ncbi:MAG: vitamin K epoxide reductase family protein [Nitrososphaerota archaeon]|nr:vitamin K epoxide reductase family protein [Nitrososphaerota archaeon]